MTYPEFLARFIDYWYDGDPLFAHLIDLETHLKRQQWHWRPKYGREAAWNFMLQRGFEFIENPTQFNFELYFDEIVRALPHLERMRRYDVLARR